MFKFKKIKNLNPKRLNIINQLRVNQKNKVRFKPQKNPQRSEIVQN